MAFSDKRYYKIREVSALLDLPASTLRYWEQQFPTVIKPRRNEGGTRFYTRGDVEKISMIRYLIKERGLKIEAAQEYIRHNPKGIEKRFEIVTRLKAVRNTLQGLLDSLHSLR